MSKFYILTAITAILFLNSCRVTKQVNKSETSQESSSKVDSSGSVKADKVTESKTVIEVTETIDSTAFITPAGKLITDPKEVTKESIAVPIKKKKTTKRIEDKKETDKTQTKTAVKKESEKKEETKAVTKDVQKSGGLPWWIWLIIVLVVLASIAWKARKLL